MKISVSTLELKGNKFLGENKLPKFRERPYNRAMDGDALLESEKHLYGHETGDRFLPYTMQDLYSREREMVSLKTIVMENDHIKAIFLPEYGMRLYSLYSKKEGRELLYVNPVFQLANLSIRNAWFSGGIEWNIGQLGHTFATCESLFVAICKDDDGKEFVRAYEYERCKGLYWHIDFHLSDDADFLAAYVRMVNPKDEDVSSYWWTNIAVPENKDVRIFSGNKEVIYINPSSNEKEGALKGMGHGAVPNLPVLPGRDVTYPENYTYASEYFFQNEKDVKQTWEAALYNDNTMFFERSSDLLKYRKMFCWGTHNGGKRWQEFLTEKGTEKYVEIQGGLAPTQVHGIIMPKNTTWDFVQVFGGTSIDGSKVKESWDETQVEVFNLIDSKISSDTVNALLEKYRKNASKMPSSVMHFGNGFGAIEHIKNPSITPEGFAFPLASIKENELVWLNLMENKTVHDISIYELPASYMVDLRYESLLVEACKKSGYTAQNLLGIMYLENGLDESAMECFKKSLSLKENPLAYRNLYVLTKDSDETKALEYFEKAISLLGKNILREYAEEYIAALTKAKLYQKTWDYYNSLPCKIQKGERVSLLMIETAIHLENVDFLDTIYDREYSILREGERGLTDFYFSYEALKHAKKTGCAFTSELVAEFEKKDNIPMEIDFRLTPKLDM